MIKINNILLLIFIILPGGILGAQDSVALDISGPELLLSKAESAFKEGNELLQTDPASAYKSYREALNYYSSLTESGYLNESLYYNIANTFIRLGDIGNGILNYRRALLFSPDDGQILSNLEYARGMQKNGFEAAAGNEILHIIFFWHYLLSPVLKIGILIAANIIFWAALIFKRFGFGGRAAIIISAVILTAMTVSAVFDLRGFDKSHGVVTAESTTGRLGDSRAYEAAFDAALYSGVEFELKQRRVGWLLAELPDGEIVWLEESDCEIVEELPRVAPR